MSSFKDEHAEIIYFLLLDYPGSSSHYNSSAMYAGNHDDIISLDVSEMVALRLAYSLGVLDNDECSLLWSHSDAVAEPPAPIDASIRTQRACSDS